MELERQGLSPSKTRINQPQVKAFVSNEDESLQLFKDPRLESLTKVHPATPLIIFVPVVIYFLWKGNANPESSWRMNSGLFLGGLVFWTFFEYALHRFVFHFEPEEDGFLKKMHFLFHGIHHAYPRDSRRLVMPPTVSIPLSTLIYFAISKLMPDSFVPAFFAGFIFGYLCYDMMHFAMHHLNLSNRVWQNIKKHHYLHHYNNNSKGFGVSSPLWDFIFLTRQRF